MTDLLQINSDATRRGITRLCHYTGSRNFIQMVTESSAILPTKVAQETGVTINVNDQERWDGRPDHISTSVEFPNAWCLDRHMERDTIFDDWLILLVDPKYLWTAGTRFCGRNAAAGSGALVAEGFDAYSSMFAATVDGQGGKQYKRRGQLLCCPTDQQAEVLVPVPIPLTDVIGIVFKDESQAKREIVRIQCLGMEFPNMKALIVPEFFDKHKLNSIIYSGRRPMEAVWEMLEG